MAVRVLESGPIEHAAIERYDDRDIETGLEQSGRSAVGATYRLVEISPSDIEDTAHFPYDWRPIRAIDALERGETLPPVVVVRTNRGKGYGLIDGVNRTLAHWLLGLPAIRAYELIVE